VKQMQVAAGSPRLILFDIDGTLISAHGIPRRAMARVLKKRFPGFKYDYSFNFSGRTDWEIVEHMLSFDRRTVTTDLIFRIFLDFLCKVKKIRHFLGTDIV